MLDSIEGNDCLHARWRKREIGAWPKAATKKERRNPGRLPDPRQGVSQNSTGPDAPFGSAGTK